MAWRSGGRVVSNRISYRISYRRDTPCGFSEKRTLASPDHSRLPASCVHSARFPTLVRFAAVSRILTGAAVPRALYTQALLRARARPLHTRAHIHARALIRAHATAPLGVRYAASTLLARSPSVAASRPAPAPTPNPRNKRGSGSELARRAVVPTYVTACEHTKHTHTHPTHTYHGTRYTRRICEATYREKYQAATDRRRYTATRFVEPRFASRPEDSSLSPPLAPGPSGVNEFPPKDRPARRQWRRHRKKKSSLTLVRAPREARARGCDVTRSPPPFPRFFFSRFPPIFLLP